MVHPTIDSGRQADSDNAATTVSSSGSGLPPARDLLERLAAAIEEYADALQRRRDREGPTSAVSREILERFRASAAQLRRIAQTRGSISLAEMLFEDFYGRKFDPATMVIVRDRPTHPSGDHTIKPGKTDIGLVPKLDFSEAQRSAKETRLRNYLRTWARSMMKSAPVRSWMERVEKHLQELRRGGVEVSAEVEKDLKTWIIEEAVRTGLSQDVIAQWRKWLKARSPSWPVEIFVEKLKNLENEHRPFAYFRVSGLEIAFERKLIPSIPKVKIWKESTSIGKNEAASYDQWTGTLTAEGRFQDTGNEIATHEIVHVFQQFNDWGMLDMADKEGQAHGFTAMLVALAKLQRFEMRLGMADNPINRFQLPPFKTMKETRDYWISVWSPADPDSLPAKVLGFSFDYNGVGLGERMPVGFVDESHINWIAKHLGFRLSASQLAPVYEALIGKSHPDWDDVALPVPDDTPKCFR